MGKMILKMTGAFFLAVVMAVTLTPARAAGAYIDGFNVHTGSHPNGEIAANANITVIVDANGTLEPGTFFIKDYDNTIYQGDADNTTITATNTVSLVSDDNGSPTDAHTELNLRPTSAALFVNTDNGVGHGVDINQTRTVLSGGTSSTSITLNDSGATFRNETTGGPARVTGVADGENDFDAVNVRQMNQMKTAAYAGIASVAALAAIPEPVPGKNFAMGVGYGNFQGSDALAVGIKARIPNKNISFTAGAGLSDDKWTTSLGFGVSF